MSDYHASYADQAEKYIEELRQENAQLKEALRIARDSLEFIQSPNDWKIEEFPPEVQFAVRRARRVLAAIDAAMSGEGDGK